MQRHHLKLVVVDDDFDKGTRTEHEHWITDVLVFELNDRLTRIGNKDIMMTLCKRH